MAEHVIITKVYTVMNLPPEAVVPIIAVNMILDTMRNRVYLWSDICGALPIACSEEGETKK